MTDDIFSIFPHIADAPNGVQKLRELIVQLAVQGKLVEQDPNDEPANVLLARITAQKEKLIKSGELRRRKGPKVVEPEEWPFVLPKTWEWTRLNVLGAVNPRNAVDDDTVGSFIPMGLIPQALGEPVKQESKAWREMKKGYTHFAERDVVVAKITPCFQNGKSAVMRGLENGIGAGTTELHVFRDVTHSLCPEYFLLFMKTPGFISEGEACMTGTAGQKRVPKEYFAFTPVSLPPLAEQKRIVAKVDELMAVCDQLEEQQQRKTKLRIRTGKSALNQLQQAQDVNDIKTAWTRIADNIHILFDHPETIPNLRATILQLAVRGKLVEQDPNDEPANVLLARITAQKEKLIKSGELRRRKGPKVVEPEEWPFVLPKTWEWTRLNVLGAVNPRNAVDDDTVGSFIPMGLIPQALGEPVKQESKAWREMKKGYTHFAERDVVVAKITPCFQNGKSAVMRGLENGIGAGTTELHVFRDVTHSLCPEYFLLFMKTPGFISEGEACMTGTAGQKRVPKEYFAFTPVSLPPLAEQHRIVAKVEELMALCDQLEGALQTADQTADRLAAAVVHQITTPEASAPEPGPAPAAESQPYQPELF